MLYNEKEIVKAKRLFILFLIIGALSFFYIPKLNFFPKLISNNEVKAQTVFTPSTELVKGSSDSASGLCVEGDVCDYKDEINYQPVCTTGGASMNMESGSANEGGNTVEVSKNSIIEPFEITIPLVLLQGSKYVDDSKKIISYDYPVYRDAQHVILDDEARRICVPGVDCEKSDAASRISDEPYGVHAITEVKSEQVTEPGDSKAVISSDPKLNSACPTVQEAKANPLKSGRYSEWLDLRFQPPGDHTTNRAFGAVDCYNGNPNGDELSEAKNFKSCIDVILPTDFIAHATYTIEHWLDCLADEDSCKKSLVTALKIDALFGGLFKCSSPDCEIRYFEYEKLKSTAPGAAQAMIPDAIDERTVNYLTPVTAPYYISTPCKIRVDKGGIYDIPCLWDISPYQRQFDIQKAAYMPLDPIMPQTFDEYWKGGVLPEVKLRSRSCI